MFYNDGNVFEQHILMPLILLNDFIQIIIVIAFF